jgi:hypothetical protein
MRPSAAAGIFPFLWLLGAQGSLLSLAGIFEGVRGTPRLCRFLTHGTASLILFVLGLDVFRRCRKWFRLLLASLLWIQALLLAVFRR